MARVLFRVSYTIPDGKRNEYLKLVGQIGLFYKNSEVSFRVYEERAQHNRFQEVFIFPSKEAYDASDDPETIKGIADIIDDVYAMATDVRYDVADEI